jgi:hypothetical protein
MRIPGSGLVKLIAPETNSFRHQSAIMLIRIEREVRGQDILL